MLELVEFVVSYIPVASIKSIRIIITIASAQGMIIFVLNISNSFQNNILSKSEEDVYITLPYLYLEWFKQKRSKHPLAPHNAKELCIQTIKSIQGTKLEGKFWYDLNLSLSQ